MKKQTRKPVIAEIENLSDLTKESVKRAVFMRKMMLSEEDLIKVSGGANDRLGHTYGYLSVPNLPNRR